MGGTYARRGLGCGDVDTVILDPADPTRALIGSHSDARWGAYAGMAVISGVHSVDRCAGRACVIHNPTPHHMRRWALHWRDDSGIFERICPEHGVGHPDPDQREYWRATGQEGLGTHGCCRCCVTPVGATGTEGVGP